jgi:SAM-dependent methyltransferase
MKPLSRFFGEIHGVDVSDEMIALAAERLKPIPHAHPHVGSGADLRLFADDSFDFIYSYAVFQHIPSKDVVFSYLRDAARVLKPGGLMRFQANNLEAARTAAETWHGCSVEADEIRSYALAFGLRLLALEAVKTQYMWVTIRKPALDESASPAFAASPTVNRANRLPPIEAATRPSRSGLKTSRFRLTCCSFPSPSAANQHVSPISVPPKWMGWCNSMPFCPKVSQQASSLLN